MTEPVIPLSEEVAEKEAARLIAAAYQPTTFRDDSPLPAIGPTPPVPQPGRPPMSQGATDASVLMLAGGASTAMVGGTAAVLMYVSQFADPVVCGLVFGAPTALVLAIARLVRGAKPEPEVHQHFHGTVTQTTTTSKNTGLIARTNNRR